MRAVQIESLLTRRLGSFTLWRRPNGARNEEEAMMPANHRHVVPHGDGWAVKAPRSTRASSLHRTQAEAINAARDILANSGGGELVIHDAHGNIRDKHTIPPARDPYPPSG